MVEDKVWIVECRAGAGDVAGDLVVRGGICVAEKGLVLTTYIDLTSEELRGRNRDEWFDLTVLLEKPNFNLVLLGVKDVDDREDKLSFPFFNLNDENENVVNLSRGDPVYGLLHSFNKPFTRSFGYLCRSFSDRIVEFPLMDSGITLDELDDSILEFWDSRIPCLCTKHIVKIKTDLDLVLECYDSDDVEEEDWDKNIVDDNFGLDDDDDNSNLDLNDDGEEINLDGDDENQLRFLHPEIPLIQVRGFGGGIGSEGGAVFDANKVFIGIYYFNSKCFQYILPKSFLALFVRDSIASLENTAATMQTNDTRKVGSAPSEKDVESVVNILKEAKDKKGEKLADDRECEVEIKEQNRKKTLLAKADDLLKLDPLMSNSFEEVSAEARWRQEYEAVNAFDDLNNPGIKSEIQLDLKSKERRRHQGNVEARVSELAFTGFDLSEAQNSQGTTSEASWGRRARHGD